MTQKKRKVPKPHTFDIEQSKHGYKPEQVREDTAYATGSVEPSKKGNPHATHSARTTLSQPRHK